MTSARDEVLARVRAETVHLHAPEGVKVEVRPVVSTVVLVGRFVERVEDYGAKVTRCIESEVEAAIGRVLDGSRSVIVPEKLPWAVSNAIFDSGQSAKELDAFDSVVTGATAAIAETGTILLSHGPSEGRRAATLLPDHHVCVVRVSQIVDDVPEAIAVMDPRRPQTWISGPSATSDIELQRVEGVHGPRRLDVIVVAADSA